MPETLTTQSEETKIETKDKKSYGHNVEMTISFRRHFDPKKDLKTGMSLDELTEKGKGQSADLGKELSGKVKGFASPKKRAGETIDLAMQNATDDAEIINKKSEENKDNRAFNIRIKKELETLQNITPIWKEGGKWADQQIAKGDETPKYDLQIQYYLDHAERAKEVGSQTPRESAQDIAHLLDTYLRMSKRLYDGSKVRLENATHGPKLETFLREVLVQVKEGKTVKGFKNLKDIGGAFQPGENFEVVVRRDDQGEMTTAMRIRGREYEIDAEELGLLTEEYNKRTEEKEKSKILKNNS